LLLLLLFIIYIVHLPVVRPRSCCVIYYFDTPALGIRLQLFDLVNRCGGLKIFLIEEVEEETKENNTVMAEDLIDLGGPQEKGRRESIYPFMPSLGVQILKL
jgi:hypothetical protein